MGKLYILSEFCDNPRIKIGITKNDVQKRIKQLSTGNPNEIFVLLEYESDNYKDIEKILHKKYNYDHERGEWFNLNLTDINPILSEIKKIDSNLTFMKKNNYFMNGNVII